MRCSRTAVVVTTLLALLALLACSLVFYTHSAGPCPEGAFPCANSSLCIPQYSICNKHVDCPLADDEESCADAHGYVDEFIGKLKRTEVSPDCRLENIPIECDCGEETALWCKSRGLTTVPQNIFNNVSKMVLANNSITLNDESFGQYCCLRLIHLEGNKLKVLPQRVFQSQIELRRILLQNNNLETIPAFTFSGLVQLQWLFLQNNKINYLNLITWVNLTKLSWIELSYNELTLEKETFPYLPSLKMLNLAENKIEVIRTKTFSQLSNLAELDLTHNQIQYIDEDSFDRLRFLDYLDLSNNCLHTLDEGIFKHLYSLDKLMLGHNPLHQVPRTLFRSLTNLSSLDLREIELDYIDTTMFEVMSKLDFVYFKQFYYCSYAPSVPKCAPNSDGISSFDDLLSKPVQRLSVWVIAIFTCGANALVILGRSTTKDENQALSFVVRNLAVSDLLMGFYLTVIAYEDVKYRGSYNNHANHWMSSITCTLTGITAMVSSEVSVLILAFLSLERFLLIAVPFSGHQKLNISTATYSLAVIWVVGVIIAVAPVLHWRNSTRFYGTNGLCFPLHIDIPYLMGWQYSAFVFLGINTAVMLLMGIVYTAMFISILKTRTATSLNLGDTEFALRFFLIVLTDTMCWAPITVIKILSLFRIPIPGSLYAWVVVFVLPVNSALNPLLYTFTTPKYCKIIKGFSFVNWKKNRQYNGKKQSSAVIDTESSMCSKDKRNCCMTHLDKKKGKIQLECSFKHLQPLDIQLSAEETF